MPCASLFFEKIEEGVKMLRLFSAAVCLLAVVSVASVFAEDDMAVDLADSLDFEEFHKEDSITIYSSESENLFDVGKEKSIDTYEENAVADKAAEKTMVPRESIEKPEVNAPQDTITMQKQEQPFEAGQKLNIRTAYTLGDSDDLKKAVFDLYRQMQHYCPAGWEKLKEWSLPKEAESHYLHYQFRCM